MREEVPLEEEEQPVPAAGETSETPAAPESVAPIAGQAPVPVNFHNGRAVRVSFAAAALVQVVLTLTAAVGASILMPIVLLGGGFYAVFLYRRRTGEWLNVVNGARLGWITGVLSFVIMTVFFTLGMAVLAGSDQLMQAYKQNISSLGLPAEAVQQVQKLMENPAAFGLSIFIGLVFQFLMLTLICSMGGALGAKLSTAKPQPRD